MIQQSDEKDFNISRDVPNHFLLVGEGLLTTGSTVVAKTGHGK